ncbi:MAG TPA: hypothetical protein DCS35_10295 [Vibrio sp.]|nr:hypothetical protein [Vibrio sp.]
MKISFNLLKDNLSWDSVIYQLNSDVLTRHVLVNGNVDDINIAFSYCEITATGSITNQNNDVLGSFCILT